MSALVAWTRWSPTATLMTATWRRCPPWSVSTASTRAGTTGSVWSSAICWRSLRSFGVTPSTTPLDPPTTSKRLLTVFGWSSVAPRDDHKLWARLALIDRTTGAFANNRLNTREPDGVTLRSWSRGVGAVRGGPRSAAGAGHSSEPAGQRIPSDQPPNPNTSPDGLRQTTTHRAGQVDPVGQIGWGLRLGVELVSYSP